MKRRTFLARILQLIGLAAAPVVGVASQPVAPARDETRKGHRVQPEPQPPLLLQISPLAGFQYHQGEACWSEIQEGAALTLVREPDNRYDDRAIRVDWRGRKLGYVPRIENATLASLMDRGHRLAAEVNAKRESPDPWQRLELRVYHLG